MTQLDQIIAKAKATARDDTAMFAQIEQEVYDYLRAFGLPMAVASAAVDALTEEYDLSGN